MNAQLTPTTDDVTYFAENKVSVEVHARILIERAIVRKAVTDLIAAGAQVALHDGEDWAVKKTTNVGEIMAGIMSVDEESLWVYGPAPARSRVIELVYGNDGWDVISDHSGSLTELLAGASKLADELEEALSA